MKNLTREEFDALESTIDTKYFGVKSAKVILKKACVLNSLQDELLYFLEDFEFVVITNQANNPINNCWVGERTKAFLTDINVQLTKNVATTDTNDGSFAEIMDHVPENDQIIQIAKDSFQISRFLNDPYLPEQKARHIYADITKNAFGKRGRFFVTINHGEQIGGFLLFSMDEAVSSSTIELIATNQNFVRKGVGRSLIQAMEQYVAKTGIKTLQVGTQLNNLAALKFYASYGFLMSECSSIYHYWPSKP